MNTDKLRDWEKEYKEKFSADYAEWGREETTEDAVKFIKNLLEEQEAGHQKRDKKLLEEFANFCHEYYRGCSTQDGVWIYSYNNDVVNYIDEFLTSSHIK